MENIDSSVYSFSCADPRNHILINDNHSTTLSGPTLNSQIALKRRAGRVYDSKVIFSVNSPNQAPGRRSVNLDDLFRINKINLIQLLPCWLWWWSSSMLWRTIS